MSGNNVSKRMMIALICSLLTRGHAADCRERMHDQQQGAILRRRKVLLRELFSSYEATSFNQDLSSFVAFALLLSPTLDFSFRRAERGSALPPSSQAAGMAKDLVVVVRWWCMVVRRARAWARRGGVGRGASAVLAGERAGRRSSVIEAGQQRRCWLLLSLQFYRRIPHSFLELHVLEKAPEDQCH